MKKSVFLIIISFCLLNNYIKAQGPTTIDQSFRPVFAAGLCGSQIDGDNYSGYKHIAYFLGVGINRQLSRRFEVEFMLTLLQKGVRSNYKTDSASLNNPNNPFTLIRLDYLEIPICFKINYKRFKAEAGGAFGYLIKNPPYDRTQLGPVTPTYPFNTFDYSFLLGAGYKLSPTVFINVRFEYSLVPAQPFPAVSGGVWRGILGGLFNKGGYNNCLMLTLNYRLPSKPSTTVPPPVNEQ